MDRTPARPVLVFLFILAKRERVSVHLFEEGRVVTHHLLVDRERVGHGHGNVDDDWGRRRAHRTPSLLEETVRGPDHSVVPLYERSSSAYDRCMAAPGLRDGG